VYARADRDATCLFMEIPQSGCTTARVMIVCSWRHMVGRCSSR